MTRDETLRLMAALSARDLSRHDAVLVALTAKRYPERFMAYLAAENREWSTDNNEFALHALRCAKRVLAGGAA